jgi:glycerophosphoryl diester phosphodiesterase
MQQPSGERWLTDDVTGPLVLAHRGASGYRPEHTLAAYELSVAMGADYIEPDLVMTRDGVLVDRHEPEIGGTTDVAWRPEFADRQATRRLDGESVTGWWVEDFTFEEFRSLRAIERLPSIRPANTAYDGRWEVPTFEEVLELRVELSERHGRTIGIIPEIKHSTYLRGLGFDPEAATLDTLARFGLNRADAPVWIQSFEVSNLISLRRDYGYHGRSLLLAEAGKAPYDLVAAGEPRSYADLFTSEGLARLAPWVDAIGPEKVMVIPRRADNTLGESTRLVTDAHAEGLLVMPWTFRAENHFLPSDLRRPNAEGVVVKSEIGRAAEEVWAYLEAGIDGMFVDNTDLYVTARNQFKPGQR